MAATLAILARELEKFYDKNTKFKDTVVVLAGYIRAHSEKVKEKVASAPAGRASQRARRRGQDYRSSFLHGQGGFR